MMLRLLPILEARQLPSRAYVYGTGIFSQRVVEQLRKFNVEVIGLIDHKRPKSNESELPLYSITSDLQITETVILGFHNYLADIRDISQKLTSIGFKDIWTAPILARSLDVLGGNLDNYWLTGGTELVHEAISHAPSIQDRLSDSESVKVLSDVINYRITGETHHLNSKHDLVDQYFPKDIAFVREDSMDGLYVDLGAFDGDTLRGLLARGMNPRGYVGLEPDPENFSKLVKETSSVNFPCITLPLAASDQTGILLLSSNDSGSAISVNGELAIQSTSIDSLLHGQKIAILKMDIEGAEKSAIQGSAETIRKWKPGLAISVYHKPEDLWEILDEVDALGVYSNFYLRTYGEQTFDTVLYCIP
jgi:FkbM family methyltransferase